MTEATRIRMKNHRRPIEAIEQRARSSTECERRVRKALTKLTNTGAPFTVENVCALAGVGKTFIYDKRRPELTVAVLAARDASRATTTTRAEDKMDQANASWRERALNAEAIAKTLRAAVKDRDERIADLTGQLYDPDGTHLADENARLRGLILTLNKNLQQAQLESSRLRRSLDGARANVKRERAIVRRRHTHKPLPAGRWVIAALDESRASHAVLQTAMDEALLRKAPLLALTSWESEPGEASEDDGDTDLRAKLHRYLDEAEDDDADVKVCALPMPDVFSNVLEQSATIDQLVIVGANNPELVAEIVGPKARTILRDTNCSLMILRGRPSS